MNLYPYQQRVKDLIHAGKSVILQAPTGAGKTVAALAPFVEAFFDFVPGAFPKKCIYAVPMRVLANQFVHEYRNLAESYSRRHRRHMNVSIQTGEQPDDRQFETDLTFATIDQVLSSFLLSPYSLPKRLSNLNAGAIASSYLVFDEFHLFDPASTLPTTLHMLKMLDGVTPFLLMTATFSSDMLAGLAEKLNAVVVPEDDQARQQMQALKSQQKTRRYHVVDEPLSAQAVLQTHKNRTLVVCNVVDRARALYEALRDHPQRQDTQVLLLHSRFLPPDRRRIENQIRALYRRDGDASGRWIVVATQAIEVGLDITCENLHTELAPANAILQRAGRCARYPSETGNVIIYSEAFDTAGEIVRLAEKIQPYSDQSDEIAHTLTEFRSRCGNVLTFTDEQNVISATHGPRDRLTIAGIDATQEIHRRKMNLVMDGQRSGDAGDLIRAMSTRRVIVHDDATAVLENPFAAESFSLHPNTVYGLTKRWLDQLQTLDLDDWGLWALLDGGDTGEDGQTNYVWSPVREPGDTSASAMVLVHPALAGYDPDLGFVPDRGTGYQAKLAVEQKTEGGYRGYQYRLESYAEHIQRVYRAFAQTVWPQLAPAAARLALVFGLTPEVIECTAHLVVLLHDVGKLNAAWQEWVTHYQDSVGQPAPAGLYAHTDFDPGNPLHQEMQKRAGHKPPHAVEGAIAVAPLLATAAQGCDAVFNATFSAIARHHGAFTRTFQRYSLHADTYQTLVHTLSWMPESLQVEFDASMLIPENDPNREPIEDYLVNPAHDDEFLIYALLARALRLADQRGTAVGTQ